jgi:hypothetical protein
MNTDAIATALPLLCGEVRGEAEHRWRGLAPRRTTENQYPVKRELGRSADGGQVLVQVADIARVLDGRGHVDRAAHWMLISTASDPPV